MMPRNPLMAADGDPRDTWYIASRTRHAERWKALRAHGIDLLCSWVDEAGQGQTSDWADLWRRCEREAKTAHTFILYADGDDYEMRGALVECGIRVSTGRPLWYLTPPDFARSLAHHPLFMPADAYIRHCIETVCAEVPPAPSLMRGLLSGGLVR